MEPNLFAANKLQTGCRHTEQNVTGTLYGKLVQLTTLVASRIKKHRSDSMLLT